jgi:hypothetical protein
MENELSKILDEGCGHPLLPLSGNSCRGGAEVSAGVSCARGESDTAGIAVRGKFCRVNPAILAAWHLWLPRFLPTG